MWPTIGGMPLNEFTTEGYFTCAFPTLFPTGAGDFLGQRQVPVTIGNYFKQYDDGHFARHPRFRFFALNTEMRHRALQTGRVYVRQRPGCGQLSLDELRDMVGNSDAVSDVHSIQSETGGLDSDDYMRYDLCTCGSSGRAHKRDCLMNFSCLSLLVNQSQLLPIPLPLVIQDLLV